MNILIVDDELLARRRLAGLLAHLGSHQISKADHGEQALTKMAEQYPDVVFMDIEMPVKSGLEAAEELKESTCKIIILTTFARTGYFERARKAGISGYLLKDSPSEELAQSIRIIMSGRKVYSPDLVDLAYNNAATLTKREEEVLALIAEGKSTTAIARQLSLTNGTVRNYISVIFDKLEVSNRVEAVTKFQELKH